MARLRRAGGVYISNAILVALNCDGSSWLMDVNGEYASNATVNDGL